MSYGQIMQPTLDQPFPGAPMREVWRRFWKKGFTFTGRASRAEYWKLTLLLILIEIVWLVVLILVVLRSAYSYREYGYRAPGGGWTFGLMGLLWVADILWGLVTLIPHLAVCVRRLHDAGYPGSCYFFSLIPILGALVLLVLLATESNPQGTRFDLNPSASGVSAVGPPAVPKLPQPRPSVPLPAPPLAAWEPPPSAAPSPAPAVFHQPPAAGSNGDRRDGLIMPVIAGWTGPQRSAVLPDGRRFVLDRPLILGRDPIGHPSYPGALCVPVDDVTMSMSKTHTVIEMMDGVPHVTDLWSTNGTVLIGSDGSRTPLVPGSPQPVQGNARIALGDCQIQLVADNGGRSTW